MMGGEDSSILMVPQGIECHSSHLVPMAWAKQSPIIAKQMFSVSVGCLASQATVL